MFSKNLAAKQGVGSVSVSHFHVRLAGQLGAGGPADHIRPAWGSSLVWCGVMLIFVLWCGVVLVAWCGALA